MGEKRIIDYSNPLQEAYRQACEELQVVTDELDRLYKERIAKGWVPDETSPLNQAYQQASEELRPVTDELDRLYRKRIAKAKKELQRQGGESDQS